MCINLGSADSQIFAPPDRDENTIAWCTISTEEQAKCEALAEALKTAVIFDEYGRPVDMFRFKCVQVTYYIHLESAIIFDRNNIT